MPVIQLPRDDRWGSLGAGLGNLLGSAVNRVEELRVMKGVSDVQQDPTIPDDQKYNAVASKYGAAGAAAYQNMERARIAQEQLRGIQEERQAGALAFQGLLNTPAGAALGVPQAGLPGVTRAPVAPIGPATGPAGTVRGSWFGNAPGWVDPSDSGPQAGGKPVSAGPGIALPSRATLGQDFDVTAPSGQTYRLKQTDVGPAAKTGRGVDINAPAAQLMGYTPKTFPTDASFKVAPAGSKAEVRANDIAQDALEGITAAQYGAVQRKQLAEAIEKANPDAPAYVKMQAFERAAKVLAPEERQAWELEKVRMNADLRVGLAELRGFQQAQLLAQRGQQTSGQIGQRGDIQERLLQERQTMLPPEMKYPDQWEGMPQKPPPGVREDVWQAALSYVQTMQMPSLGFQAGMRNQVITAAPAAAHALGIAPDRLPQAASQYMGQRHAEMALGTRVANLSTSIFEAQKMAPQVSQTSKAVPRTGLGPFFNRWVTGSELQSGDPEIVQFQAALNSFLNIYSRGINPTGRLTDQQQRHAYETLDTAMSKGQVEAGVQQLLTELDVMRQGLGQAVKEVPEYFSQPGQQVAAPAAPAGTPGGTDWSKKSDDEILKEIGIRK